MTYEVVVGVEVHAQLATRTKLFCGCGTAFGRPPNTQTCPVCLGLPGSLPVTNRRAFELALLTAYALGCEVAPRTRFDRKNYYYPDLPKNYQISQSYAPLGVRGMLRLSSGKEVSIDNVHLEEDAGKLLHEGTGDRSLVDLNRAGIPLVEIVSGPDLRSLEEVDDYMETLRLTLLHLGVSECKMQEGDLRFEASISLRPPGEAALGNRVEIKNLNSTKNVLAALRHEIARQTAALDRGERVARETRLWDDARGETARMRSKEEAHDYRYFPEPDLVPIAISAAWAAKVRAELVELPRARRRRFVEQYRLSDYDAGVLTGERATADYFERLAALVGDAKAAANWVMNDLLARGRRFPAVERVARLIALVTSGVVSGSAARQEILPALYDGEKDPDALVAEKGLAQESDRAALAAIVAKVIAENPKQVADFKAGKQQVLGWLMGQCMKASKGKGNPRLFGEILREALARA